MKPTLRENTRWKTIDGDLSTLGKLKAQVTKLLKTDEMLLFGFHEQDSYISFCSNLFKLRLEGISNAMLLIIP